MACKRSPVRLRHSPPKIPKASGHSGAFLVELEGVLNLEIELQYFFFKLMVSYFDPSLGDLQTANNPVLRRIV